MSKLNKVFFPHSLSRAFSLPQLELDSACHLTPVSDPKTGGYCVKACLANMFLHSLDSTSLSRQRYRSEFFTLMWTALAKYSTFLVLSSSQRALNYKPHLTRSHKSLFIEQQSYHTHWLMDQRHIVGVQYLTRGHILVQRVKDQTTLLY